MNKSFFNPWHSGQLVCFSGLDGPTDYAAGLVARTRADRVLRIEFPVSWELALDTAGHAGLTHDVIRSGASLAVVIDAHHLLITGPCRERSSVPDALRIVRGEGRTLVGVAAHWRPDHLGADIEGILTRRLAWTERLRVPPSADRGAAYRKAVDMMRGQIYSPEGRFATRWSTPDRWPHKDLWLWDSAFHAIGWRHLDPGLARELITAVVATQDEAGFIPHQANPGWRSDVTQPPVLAQAVGLVDEITPDDDWLAVIYPALRRQLEWTLANRDPDGSGLCKWVVDATNPTNRCDESGMDNSPRFDAAIPLEATDLNSYLAHECEWMAGFAERLGLAADASRWRDRHARLVSAIRTRLWDEDKGFFFDRDNAAGTLTGIWAATGFLPLVCGAVDASMAERLAGHLAEGGWFDTAVPISSAPPSGGADTGDMWRGPMWINMNWMIARGFERAGLGGLADRLRTLTRAEVERWHASHGTIFEFYDTKGATPPPLLPRKGKCDPSRPFHQVIHDYGWSAALYVDLCHEADKRAHAKVRDALVAELS